MARYEGMFMAPSNYEPLIAAPFDARELVETQADLLKPETWTVSGGRGLWAYIGMKVSVAADPDSSKNGLYILAAADFTQLFNWNKLADQKDIVDISIFQNRVAALEEAQTNLAKADETFLATLQGKANANEVYSKTEIDTKLAALNDYKLPIATMNILGGVKLSKEVGVNAEGQLAVNEISTDKLTQGAEELILNGGNA